MSERVTTRYNWKDLEPTGLEFSAVEITDAGADAFYFPERHAFLETDFTLNTQADGLGTDITGFALSEQNDFLTGQYGSNVYEKLQITDPTYQTGTIYAFGYYSGDIVFAEDPNNLQSQIDALQAGTNTLDLGAFVQYATYKDRPGLLPAGLDNAVNTGSYPAWYAEIGHAFNQAHVEVGDDDLSGQDTLFYPTLPPGYFTRTGAPNSASIDSTADVDDTAENITLATVDYNQFKLFKAPAGTGANGVPVIVKIETGLLPTGLSENTVYYIRFLTTPDIELYDTEANATDTSGTTGRVGLTDAVGTFILSQEGICIDDSMQGHWHDSYWNGAAGYASGGNNLSNAGNNTVFLDNDIVQNAGTDGINGTPRTANETRGRQQIMFGYWKVESVVYEYGEPVSALRYDTGWVSNSDWTDFNPTINHALSTDLSDLIVKVFLSVDGTENNAFEMSFTDRNPSATYGIQFNAIDTDNIAMQTGADGISTLDSSGVIVVLGASSTYYYKIVVIKPNLIATYADTSFRRVYEISDSTDITHTLPDASGYLTEQIIKRRGAGSGQVIVTPQGSQKIYWDGVELSSLTMGANSSMRLFPSGGNWEVEDFKGYYETGWINRSDWTNVHMGTADTKNVDSDVNHNMAQPQRKLKVKVFISTDGTDANSFEPVLATLNAANQGLSIEGVDNDNVIAQTGASGIAVIDSAGNTTGINTEDWYYNIVVEL